MLKYGRLLNFVPHLKGLRNIDTDFNLTFQIASVILIFTNQELNKIEYQNRKHSYQTILAIKLYFTK